MMTQTLAILATLALTAFLARLLRKPRVFGDVPLTAAQREFQYRARLDAAIGLRSETYQEMHARGSEAKRRLLAELRNRQQRKRNAELGIPVTVRKQKLRLAR